MVPNPPPTGPRVLERVREGMAVYDVVGDRLGTVERVYLGEAGEAEARSGTGPATLSPPAAGGRPGPLDEVARLFSPDTLPGTLRARLLYHGFVRVDAAGLFGADRYVTPDQIAGVTANEVRLRVTREQLIAA